MSDKPIHNYARVLTDLKERIRTARMKASLAVNKELLMVYWEIGKTLLDQREEEGWGTKIIERVSADLKAEFPDFKGLSTRNLKYMRVFAEAYPDFVIGQQPAAQMLSADNQSVMIGQQTAAQLPWGHHQLILDKVHDRNNRLFYISKAVENSWSRNVLAAQIESKLHDRQGKALSNFTSTLPANDSDLATEIFKNPYVFDFLTLGEKAKERDLERALIQHLKSFMLELGKGFAYVGNQYNLNLAGDDFFLDLLFFNYKLNCFVVFELKIGEFKPEYAGKLNFYINAVNEQVRDEHHKPTIGVLLCRTPNDTVIKYSLSGIDQPMGVADYHLEKALPKEIKGDMPSIEELEAEIEKEYKELKSPSQKRFDALKQKIASLKTDEIQKPGTEEDYVRIVNESLVPLFATLMSRLSEYQDLFLHTDFYWHSPSGNVRTIEEFAAAWNDFEHSKLINEHHFVYWLHGFKKAGVHGFSAGVQLKYIRSTYYYGLELNNHNNNQPFIQKLYHQKLDANDIEKVCEVVCGQLMDEIESGIERVERRGNE